MKQLITFVGLFASLFSSIESNAGNSTSPTANWCSRVRIKDLYHVDETKTKLYSLGQAVPGPSVFRLSLLLTHSAWANFCTDERAHTTLDRIAYEFGHEKRPNGINPDYTFRYKFFPIDQSRIEIYKRVEDQLGQNADIRFLSDNFADIIAQVSHGFQNDRLKAWNTLLQQYVFNINQTQIYAIVDSFLHPTNDVTRQIRKEYTIVNQAPILLSNYTLDDVTFEEHPSGWELKTPLILRISMPIPLTFINALGKTIQLHLSIKLKAHDHPSISSSKTSRILQPHLDQKIGTLRDTLQHEQPQLTEIAENVETTHQLWLEYADASVEFYSSESKDSIPEIQYPLNQSNISLLTEKYNSSFSEVTEVKTK